MLLRPRVYSAGWHVFGPIHSIHGLPNAAWIAFIVGQQFASGGRADPIQEIMRIKIKIKDQKAKAILGLDSWTRPAVTTMI